MADKLNLDEALADIIASTPSSNQSFIQIANTSEGGQTPDRMQSMLQIFQSAFPDMDFTIADNAEGQKSVKGRQKQQPAGVSNAIPDGFSPQRNAAGIQDLQSALEKAATDEDKLQIAVKLNAAVQTQKAFNFTKYKQQAEAEFGVPDLIQATNRIQQSELASPFNPGTGMPSAQRLQILEVLGIARVRASNRVNELAQNDITLAGAENLAKSVIVGLEKGLAVAGKQGLLEDKEARRLTKETAIGAMDPNFIQNVSILRNATADPTDSQRRAIAEGIYDNKIKLTEIERLLATATPDSIKGFYLTAKEPKHKEQALQLLEAKEIALIGDEKQAKRNMTLFKQAYTHDVADLATTGDAQLSTRVKQKNAENIARYPDKKERDIVNAQDRVAFQNEYLNRIVNNAFSNDVSGWQGVIQSDDTAKSVLKQMRAYNPKELNMRKFIIEYLNYNDGKSLGDKSKAIQAISASALSAFPQSVVLPLPSEESIQMQTQRMIASAYVGAQFRFATSPFMTDNPFRQ